MERMESKMLDMLERKYSLTARALHKKDYENVIVKVDPKLEFEVKNRFIDEQIEQSVKYFNNKQIKSVGK
jgi:hypothetical protein